MFQETFCLPLSLANIV